MKTKDNGYVNKTIIQLFLVLPLAIFLCTIAVYGILALEITLLNHAFFEVRNERLTVKKCWCPDNNPAP